MNDFSESNESTLSTWQLWVLFFAGFLLLSILVLAVASLPLHGQSLLSDHLNDAGHVLVFAVLTIIGYVATRILRLSTIWRFIVVIAASAFLGMSIEILQHFTPFRTASYKDFIRDLIGITAGLFILLAFTNSISMGKFEKYRRQIFVILATLVFLIGFKSVFGVLRHYASRNSFAPVLLTADDDWWDIFAVADHLDFWRSSAPVDWPSDRSFDEVLNVNFHSTKFSLIGLRDPYPDWSSWDRLEFHVYSYSPDPFELHLRIHDREHNDDYLDRYNGVFRIERGFQTITIPIREIQSQPQTRPLDLKNIAGLTLFTHDLKAECRVAIDEIRLR